MIHDNNEVILELWARLKSHVPVKERLEIADLLVSVFDEYNMLDESLLNEDLDKELQTAARSHLVVADDFGDEDENSY
jgi:hypothetical protein